MSDEENKRLFDHYTNVANGNVKSGNAVRDDLNVSDAKRHLADLVKKNPELEVKEEEPKEDYPEDNINKAPEKRKPKTKSKVKK